MKKTNALVLFAAIAVCAISCRAATITWGYDGDLGGSFQAGWVVELFEDVNRDGIGGYDDQAVAGISTVLVSGKSGINWGTTFQAPAGSLNLGDHIYSVIYNAPTAGQATRFIIIDDWPSTLPASDQDADYIMSSVPGIWVDLATEILSARAGANGTISPSNTVYVEAGANETFSITAANDYNISDVLVDGSSVGPTNSYTFHSVILHHTISATFTPILAAKGTPLWWLHSYGLTNDPNVAEIADPDGDGLLTWQEYVAGTDPTNPASCFRINTISGVDIGQPPVISWDTTTGRLYSVYSRTNLLVSPWITNAWRLPCNGTPLTYTNSGSNAPVLFFHLGVEKP